MDRVGEGLDEAEEDLDEMDGKSGCCGTGKKKKQKEKRSEANKKSKKLKYKKMGDGDEYQVTFRNRHRISLGQIHTFLVACTRLYKSLCRSVRPSVGWSVRRLVTLLVFQRFSEF